MATAVRFARFTGAGSKGNPVRQQMLIPSRKNPVLDPTFATSTLATVWRPDNNEARLKGESVKTRVRIRPQGQHPANRRLQHSDVAHVLVFCFALIQTGSDNDAHGLLLRKADGTLISSGQISRVGSSDHANGRIDFISSAVKGGWCDKCGS